MICMSWRKPLSSSTCLSFRFATVTAVVPGGKTVVAYVRDSEYYHSYHVMTYCQTSFETALGAAGWEEVPND